MSSAETIAVSHSFVHLPRRAHGGCYGEARTAVVPSPLEPPELTSLITPSMTLTAPLVRLFGNVRCCWHPGLAPSARRVLPLSAASHSTPTGYNCDRFSHFTAVATSHDTGCCCSCAHRDLLVQAAVRLWWRLHQRAVLTSRYIRLRSNQKCTASSSSVANF